jgi:hypothetical protein
VPNGSFGVLQKTHMIAWSVIGIIFLLSSVVVPIVRYVQRAGVLPSLSYVKK